MEPTTRALEPFQQLGAIGVVAGLLLLLVVGLFKLFVNHALKTNAELLKQNFEMQEKTLGALGDLTSSIRDLSSDVREMDRTVGQMFNELSAVTGGSRGYAMKPPRRGG